MDLIASILSTQPSPIAESDLNADGRAMTLATPEYTIDPLIAKIVGISMYTITVTTVNPRSRF